MKWLEIFLFDKDVVRSINTFIILNIIIHMLKNRKKEKKEFGKVLYLTSQLLIQAFPPNFNFIFQFINSIEYDNEKWKQLYNWNMLKIENVKEISGEEVPYFPDKSYKQISEEEFQLLLHNIDIKYIDEEVCLPKTLYKCYEPKKYKLVIVNIAFLYVPNNSIVHSFFQMIGEPEPITTGIQISDSEGSEIIDVQKSVMPDKIEKEICDSIFLNNIANISRHYAFFRTFVENMNHSSLMSFEDYSSDENVLNEEKEKEESIKRNDKLFLKDSEDSTSKMKFENDSFNKKSRVKNEKTKRELKQNYSSNEYLTNEATDHKKELGNSSNISYNCSLIKNYNENSNERTIENPDGFLHKSIGSSTNKKNLLIDKYISNYFSPQKKIKKKLVIYDLIPNSDALRYMYYNMLSSYCNHVHVISSMISPDYT